METPLEHILTHLRKADMIAFMESHPEHFGELIKLAFSMKYPYLWRATWLLWSCIKENDPRLRGYSNRIIDKLRSANDQHKRELLILLSKIEMDKSREGELFDICVRIWMATEKMPSLRYHAFITMVKIAGKHPDLVNEIALLGQAPYLDSLSAGAKKSVHKVLHDLIENKGGIQEE